ncbi:2'-5' RNA ligase family protein [Micromonospora globbae]|uniref:2'-5' RNA ligase family protein n=1 Tax=Micromonospora globbae TaxID=1894969 RepID=UPI003B8A6425
MAVPHATHIRNHWYWRPGWGIGSRFYTWHITFDGQPEVEHLADQYRHLLSQQPSLDVIPNQWLHLTMQGIGFVHNVTPEDVDAIVAATRARCAHLAPFKLTIGAPHVDPESIQIAVDPVEPVRQLRYRDPRRHRRRLGKRPRARTSGAVQPPPQPRLHQHRRPGRSTCRSPDMRPKPDRERRDRLPPAHHPQPRRRHVRLGAVRHSETPVVSTSTATNGTSPRSIPSLPPADP